MLGRSERLVRGGIAGSFAITTAAISHVVGGGATPSALALTTGMVFAALFGTLAIGARPSLPRLGVAVTGSQLAFHLVFSYLSPGASAHVVAGHHGAPGSIVVGAAVPHADSPAMWMAHAAAMLATLVFLRRAELAVWSMIRRAAARLGSFDRILGGPRPRGAARLVPGGEPAILRPAPFLTAFSLRGPPVVVAR